MSKVTIEQLKEVEDKLIRGDKTQIANNLKMDRAVVTQVIKYKHVHLSDAYSVYLAAKDLIEQRENSIQ